MLIEFCDLCLNFDIEGYSFMLQLKDFFVLREWLVIMIYNKDNYLICSECFCYICYVDGLEEFYDLLVDLQEWNNLVMYEVY